MSDAIYFLDAQVAQAEAFLSIEKALKQDQTLEDVALCYYHADQKIDSDAPNCVWLPLESIYDFFQYSQLPLPTKINFSGALQFLENDVEFIAEFNAILKQVDQYRNQLLSLYVSSPLNRDALFFNAQIALLTAIKGYTFVRGRDIVKQKCYYLGSKLDFNIDNLIHIDLDHYVSFFASSVNSFPNIIVPSADMSHEESKRAENTLKELNRLVLKHKCMG